MMKEVYSVVSDESELKWFFDNVIQKPQVNESYSMVFVCRHKKLTKEEKAAIGMSSKETEFLATQTLRLAKFHSATEIDNTTNWTFNKFLQQIRRFEVNKEAYVTSEGNPLPDKSLVTIFYINPCDDIKVARRLIQKLDETGDSIIKAMLNGKSLDDNLQSYQAYTNIESSVKHLKANCKGSNYWMDFDIDVPNWFRRPEVSLMTYDYVSGNGLPAGTPLITVAQCPKYYRQMIEKLDNRFGKGNYIIVSTSGGYHILVRTHAIKSNPHDFCKEVEAIYKQGVADGNQEYLDEKGVCKFECIVNDSQIPGLPLPGTYQYGRPVKVLNKEDFIKPDEEKAEDLL